MIQEIIAKNFLSIHDAHVQFRRLNLVIGENSAGKSALLKAVLALVHHIRNQAMMSEANASIPMFKLSLREGEPATFHQVVNDAARKSSRRDAEIFLEARFSDVDEARIFATNSRYIDPPSLPSIANGSLVVGYALRDAKGRGNAEVVYNDYFYSVHVRHDPSEDSEEFFNDESGERDSRWPSDWGKPVVRRLVEPLEQGQRSRKLRRTGWNEPRWQWREELTRFPDRNDVRLRPHLCKLVSCDNSDIEWRGNLQQDGAILVPQLDLDPVTDLIESILNRFAQLQASKRLVGGPLAKFSVDGEAIVDRQDSVFADEELSGDELDGSIFLGGNDNYLGDPSYDDHHLDDPSYEWSASRQSSEASLLHELATGFVDGIPQFLFNSSWGRPPWLREDALRILFPVAEGVGEDDESFEVLVQNSVARATESASEVVSRVVHMVLNDKEYRDFLDEEIRQQSSRIARNRSLDNSGVFDGSRFSGWFHPELNSGVLDEALARSLQRLLSDGVLTSGMVALCSTLAIATPIRLRGSVWQSLESKNLEIPETFWRLVSPSGQVLKNVDGLLTAQKYLETVGRVGSDKSEFFFASNYWFRDHSGDGFPISYPDEDAFEIGAGRALKSLVRGAESLQHISAIRSPLAKASSQGGIRLNSDGSNSIQVISDFGSAMISKPPRPSEIRPEPRFLQEITVATCLAEWLAYLGLITDFRVDQKPFAGTRLSVATGHSIQKHDLSEVGSGVGQVLPVLLAPLLTDPGRTVVLEEPEAHLHPAAQVALADFIVACSNSGRQLIVETHSEHIVNRVRRRIAEGKLDPGHVQMLGAESNANSGTTYSANTFTADGTFEGDWPEGFLGVALDDAVEFGRSQMARRGASA